MNRIDAHHIYVIVTKRESFLNMSYFGTMNLTQFNQDFGISVLDDGASSTQYKLNRNTGYQI